MFLPQNILALCQGKKQLLRIHKAGTVTQAYLAQAFLEKGRDVVVILPGQKELNRFRALTSLFAPEGQGDFWDKEWITFPRFSLEEAPGQEWAKRWVSLFSLQQRLGPKGVLLTVDALFPKYPPRKVLENEHEYIVKGEEQGQEAVVSRIVSWGYRRVSVVTEPGEFAVRGDILDIYSPGYGHPLRLEFFGDLLEDLRFFEPLTQRSVEDREEAVILPVKPCILGESYEKQAKKGWEELWKAGNLPKPSRMMAEQKLAEGTPPPWPGWYYPQAESLEKWLPDNPVYLLPDAQDIRSRLEEEEWRFKEYFLRMKEEKEWQWPAESAVIRISQARDMWLDKNQAVFESLVVGQEKRGFDLPEKHVASYQDVFWPESEKSRPWKHLVKKLHEWSRTKNQVILSFHSQQSRSKFLKLIEPEQISFSREYSLSGKGLFALVSNLSSGAILEWNDILILPEDVLQPSHGTRVTPRRREDFVGLKSFEEIREGDFLVHREYGLARFGGLQRVHAGQTKNDYLLLFYANDDKLFVPVDRLGLVQKYKGPEGVNSSLDSLGGTRWQKTRERARKAIEQVARELVEMYAYRKVAKGFSYGPLGELYREFEATFGFEETPDQATAITQVLHDMEKDEPMDRLVCGDVGFGKTEVALRAAFRAVQDNKQVALLCPTTVLAEQHFQNFRQRLMDFPISVSVLSRFVPKSRQTNILNALKRGEIDILIGTHRILSNDVHIPNLGLLILDEEQRFGVKHKEKIKDIRKTVDVLTLTATPIPRTLQLSLSGIRSLSVIETPPQERKPVETYLVEREPEMLKAVLEKELQRGGQVFWVYNRVRGLERVREFVQSLVPEAEVGMAHGQMSERKLEDTMHAFWHGELDVLVCTSIIESGLDFPRANTLIVDNAQMFGLGQLYQLRGRVGRSERQAYAYFVAGSLDSLTDKARRRLQVVMDMDYLGAGFQVAMEDLRLRGAGNILGEVQSGQIANVGLDLYLEMLEDEVRKLKGDEKAVESDPEFSIGFPAHIPSTYMEDGKDRLRYYKALSTAAGEEEIDELESEVRDRFGPLPPPLENFIELMRLKRVLAKLQVIKADFHPGKALLTWPESSASIDPEKILGWVQERQQWTKLVPPSKLELQLDETERCSHNLKVLKKDLENLV